MSILLCRYLLYFASILYEDCCISKYSQKYGNYYVYLYIYTYIHIIQYIYIQRDTHKQREGYKEKHVCGDISRSISIQIYLDPCISDSKHSRLQQCGATSMSHLLSISMTYMTQGELQSECVSNMCILSALFVHSIRHIYQSMTRMYLYSYTNVYAYELYQSVQYDETECVFNIPKCQTIEGYEVRALTNAGNLIQLNSKRQQKKYLVMHSFEGIDTDRISTCTSLRAQW